MSSATEIREIQIQARKKHIRLKTRNKKVSAFLANLTTDEAKRRRQHFDNYTTILWSCLVFFRLDFLKISAVICRQEMPLFVSRQDVITKHKKRMNVKFFKTSYRKIGRLCLSIKIFTTEFYEFTSLQNSLLFKILSYLFK